MRTGLVACLLGCCRCTSGSDLARTQGRVFRPSLGGVCVRASTFNRQGIYTLGHIDRLRSYVCTYVHSYYVLCTSISTPWGVERDSDQMTMAAAALSRVGRLWLCCMHGAPVFVLGHGITPRPFLRHECIRCPSPCMDGMCILLCT